MESGSLRAFSRGVLVVALQFMFPSIDGNVSLKPMKIKREFEDGVHFFGTLVHSKRKPDSRLSIL
jgi:hypothetical protein